MAVATDWRSFLGETAFVAAREQVSTLTLEIQNLFSQITNLNREKIGLESALKTDLTTAQRAATEAEIAKVNARIAIVTEQYATKTTQRDNLQADVTKATTEFQAAKAVLSAKDGSTAPAATVDPGKAKDEPVTYNIGGVKDAYFGNISLMDNGRVGLTGRGDGNDQIMYINNTPARVKDATDLWSTSQASKGMLQTYLPRAAASNDIFAGLDASSAGDVIAGTSLTRQKKYGFQFLYNPNVVTMNVSGAAAVDYMKYVASPVKVMPDTGTSGYISFEILLNRMHDFQYIRENGTLRNNLTVEQVYGSAATAGSQEELAKIYKLGTMYDIEYLFKSIIGIEYNTQFRGVTADLGFLTGVVVELHIGQSMRYLVVINNIKIVHSLFDNRMVPLSSIVEISASRIPDYQTAAKEG